jgi:hypothetical protein
MPFVTLNGVDQHFFGNTGVLANDIRDSGTGIGVQLEALIPHRLTPMACPLVVHMAR